MTDAVIHEKFGLIILKRGNFSVSFIRQIKIKSEMQFGLSASFESLDLIDDGEFKGVLSGSSQISSNLQRKCVDSEMIQGSSAKIIKMEMASVSTLAPKCELEDGKMETETSDDMRPVQVKVSIAGVKRKIIDSTQKSGNVPKKIKKSTKK